HHHLGGVLVGGLVVFGEGGGHALHAGGIHLAHVVHLVHGVLAADGLDVGIEHVLGGHAGGGRGGAFGGVDAHDVAVGVEEQHLAVAGKRAEGLGHAFLVAHHEDGGAVRVQEAPGGLLHVGHGNGVE